MWDIGKQFVGTNPWIKYRKFFEKTERLECLSYVPPSKGTSAMHGGWDILDTCWFVKKIKKKQAVPHWATEHCT